MTPTVRTRVRTRTPALKASGSTNVPQPFDLTHVKIEPILLSKLRLPNRKLRRRHAARIRSHADCMLAHKVPALVLALRSGEVVYGDDNLEAYRLMGQSIVPVIYVDDRPPAQLAALRVWLDRYHSEGEVDPGALKLELETICEFDPDWLASTHMTMPEIDFALYGSPDEDAAGSDRSDPGDKRPAITVANDLWAWSGGHRLICGNSREAQTFARLMDGETADLFATDPPFGTTVAAISQSHPEWKDGSGMSDEEATGFASEYLASAMAVIKVGALFFLFIDWKGLYPLLTAVRGAGLTQKTLCTWDKGQPGQGGLYRNQSEHIIVAQHGKPPKGVQRPKRKGLTTIWSAPGYASFRPDRAQALKDHACTKPQSILMDMILDGSLPGEIVLDPFGGSGSMTIAAQRTRRRCYSVEIEERFCDIAIRRMHEVTGEYPVHLELGLTFEEVAKLRGIAIEESAAAPTQGGTDAQES